MAEIVDFGTKADGRAVRAVTIRSGGLEARFLDLGARLVALTRDGGPNACLPVPDVASAEGALRYAGPVIGPVLNRIAGAAAEIAGRPCRFDPNEGPNSLHSGPDATHLRIWEIAEHLPDRVRFAIDLPDGRGGFPGNRRIEADWRIGDALDLEITATSDAETLMNPGLHGVFTPGGVTDPTAMVLEIPSDRFLPTGPGKIPTGEIAAVKGTPFDHRAARSPERTIDHNYCFGTGYGLRARLSAGGAVVEILSDAPGLQVFTGRDGVALEPQLWPDAPHHRAFPSIVLGPGDVFRQRMRIALGA